jgi:hypothetical protein
VTAPAARQKRLAKANKAVGAGKHTPKPSCSLLRAFLPFLKSGSAKEPVVSGGVRNSRPNFQFIHPSSVNHGSGPVCNARGPDAINHPLRGGCLPVCGHKDMSSATHESGPVPARNAAPKSNSIHALTRPARKPDLAEELCSWRAQGDGKSSVQLLVFASSGLRLALAGHFSPTIALAALDGMGHGQGVFVSKHSTAIPKRGATPCRSQRKPPNPP